LNKSASIGFRRKPPGNAAAADRLRAWTRERFALPPDAPIMVAEVTCAVPGCPPLETVVAFWTGTDTRHHFKVFKPLAEVLADDLPPAFLKNALADIEGFGCECC
jgi:nitrate reductase delta subunit